jgi:hypothetical protein
VGRKDLEEIQAGLLQITTEVEVQESKPETLKPTPSMSGNFVGKEFAEEIQKHPKFLQPLLKEFQEIFGELPPVHLGEKIVTMDLKLKRSGRTYL